MMPLSPTQIVDLCLFTYIETGSFAYTEKGNSGNASGIASTRAALTEVSKTSDC